MPLTRLRGLPLKGARSMSIATATPSANDQINWTRYRPGQKKGHYESFYQRANHPTKPWAFWIRYTIFSPEVQARGGDRRALGHLLRRRDGGACGGQGGIPPLGMPLRSGGLLRAGEGPGPRAGEARGDLLVARRLALVGPDLRGRSAPALPPAEEDVPRGASRRPRTSSGPRWRPIGASSTSMAAGSRSRIGSGASATTGGASTPTTTPSARSPASTTRRGASSRS